MSVFALQMWPAVCLLLAAAGVATAADADMYPDLPDVIELEELAKTLEARHMQQLQRRIGGVDLVAGPEPDFSYQFAPDQQVSQFAAGPTDPRYYQDSVQLMRDDTEAQRVQEDDDTFQPPQPPAPAPRPAQTPVRVTQPLTPDEEANAHVQQVPTHAQDDSRDHIYFIAIVGGCSAAAVVGVIAIAISWYKLQRNAKAAADVEYPAYGVTGPHKDSSPTGDRKLAQSAQMYHYQHQKQQIIALENRVASERAGSVSDNESDEENEEGDYTVYECPGLAPAGEMEVKNPLFLDDPTPATSAVPANHSRPGDVTAKK